MCSFRQYDIRAWRRCIVSVERERESNRDREREVKGESGRESVSPARSSLRSMPSRRCSSSALRRAMLASVLPCRVARGLDFWSVKGNPSICSLRCRGSRILSCPGLFRPSGPGPNGADLVASGSSGLSSDARNAGRDDFVIHCCVAPGHREDARRRQENVRSEINVHIHTY